MSTTSQDRDPPDHHLGDVAPVDVWLSKVDHPMDDAQWAWLDDAERARADRFRFERDRVWFVNRRSFTRLVLARYLDSTPDRVRIRTTDHGRPEAESCDGLVFSTSHSEGIAVVAVTHGRPIGVDIERFRPVPDDLTSADGLFSEREADALGADLSSRQARTFLSLWTRKEAVAKADGRGIAIPLDRVDVLSADGEGQGQARGEHGDLPFVYADLRRSDEWVGAVALAVGVEASCPRISLREVT